jgi:hypothetical protein
MPMPGEENNAVDYIYSANNLQYTEWKKRFAIFPKKTIKGNSVWLRFVYTRMRKHIVEPPQFPRGALTKRQWATLEEIFEMKLREEA